MSPRTARTQPVRVALGEPVEHGGEASTPHTGVPVRARGTARRPEPTPSSSTGTAGGELGEGGDRGGGVADVGVPVVVDVGERIAVGVRPVAVDRGHRRAAPSRAGRNVRHVRPVGRTGQPAGGPGPHGHGAAAACRRRPAPGRRRRRPAGARSPPAADDPRHPRRRAARLEAGARRRRRASPPPSSCPAQAAARGTHPQRRRRRRARRDLHRRLRRDRARRRRHRASAARLRPRPSSSQGLALAFVTAGRRHARERLVRRSAGGPGRAHRRRAAPVVAPRRRLGGRARRRGRVRHRPARAGDRADDVVRHRQRRRRLRGRRARSVPCGARRAW